MHFADVTPMNFFFWGHAKSLVYETPVDTEMDLVARILAAAEEVCQSPEMLERMQQSMMRSCTVYLDHGGRHYEQLF